MSAVVFAGGGTGGHIFPGIAVLEKLREHDPDIAATFLVSTRGVDARILGSRGLPFVEIPAAPLITRPGGLVRFAWRWGGAVRAARAALRSYRSEHGSVRILSTGGFVSAPVAQAARVERLPLVLLNQDSPPGKANRWIARHSTHVLTTADAGLGTWERIPPVVRREAIAPAEPGQCRESLGLDPTRPTLLVTGASQGARSINEFAAAFCGTHAEFLRDTGWQIIHQTGSDDNTSLEAAYRTAGVPAVVRGFFDAMGLCWGAADCAVSRSGAGSVAEAWANRVPSLFLPYPYHRDQHQRRNASPLERAGAAIIEQDLIQPGPNLDRAGARLVELLTDRARIEAMAGAFSALGAADGADRVSHRLREMG